MTAKELEVMQELWDSFDRIVLHTVNVLCLMEVSTSQYNALYATLADTPQMKALRETLTIMGVKIGKVVE